MSERVILHCDLNNFYASVECYLNPELRDKFVAVCGNTQERHGIVLAKNEKAKKMGVKTGEAIWQAKQKCPLLTVVAPHFDEYIDFSRKVKEIYLQYSDMVEGFGIDEYWIDITGSTRIFGSKEKIAREIMERVRDEVGLTISVGVSYNKILAKLGSDMKKPYGLTIIEKWDLKNKVWHLPCGDLFGVGSKTNKVFQKMGIKTIGDIANFEKEYLSAWLGKNGLLLWHYANGLDSSPVLKDSEIPPPKSIGRGTTTREDMHSLEDISPVLLALTERVAHSMRKNKFLANVVQVSVKSNDFIVHGYQKKIKSPTRLVGDLHKIGLQLIKENYSFHYPVRSVTIRVMDLVSEDYPIQLNLEMDLGKQIKHDILETEVYNLRNRFGKNAIVRASALLS